MQFQDSSSWASQWTKNKQYPGTRTGTRVPTGTEKTVKARRAVEQLQRRYITDRIERADSEKRHREKEKRQRHAFLYQIPAALKAAPVAGKFASTAQKNTSAAPAVLNTWLQDTQTTPSQDQNQQRERTESVDYEWANEDETDTSDTSGRNRRHYT